MKYVLVSGGMSWFIYPFSYLRGRWGHEEMNLTWIENRCYFRGWEGNHWYVSIASRVMLEWGRWGRIKEGGFNKVERGSIKEGSKLKDWANLVMLGFSFVGRVVAEDAGSESYGYQDWSVSQYRCWFVFLLLISHLAEGRGRLIWNFIGTMSPKEHGECFVLKGKFDSCVEFVIWNLVTDGV